MHYNALYFEKESIKLFFSDYFYFDAHIALLQPVFFHHSNDKITNVPREESVPLDQMLLTQVCL
jgi:hypothetical protein